MFRMLGAVWGASISGLLATAFTIGGFDLDDPQLEESLHWARAFTTERPAVTRALAVECAAEVSHSPLLTRDRAVQLFDCVRHQAEARGYA